MSRLFIEQIEVIDFGLNNLSQLEELIKKSDYVINLVGLLFEKSNSIFFYFKFILKLKII